MPVKGTLSDNGLLPSSSLLILFRVLLYLWYILRVEARLAALIKLLYCKLNRDVCICVCSFERLQYNVCLKFYGVLAGPHIFKLCDITWNDNIV